jgi:hypothetical protein
MANTQEINELFQLYRGRPAQPDEMQRFGSVDYDTLKRSLGQPWGNQREWVRNFFLEHLGREPNERDYAVYATAPPDRVVDDVFRSPEYYKKQLETQVQDLTKDDFLIQNRDEFAEILDREKYNELNSDLDEEAQFAEKQDTQSIADQLADLDRNKGYYTEDANTNLARLDRNQGYATTDYNANVQQQQFQNTLARRNREANLNRRGVYSGGIADTLRKESEQQLNQPLTAMQKAYQRRLEGYGDQRSDINKGLKRYNTNYDTQVSRLNRRGEDAQTSRERQLKKARRNLRNQRDQELGTKLTNDYQDYLTSKSF